MNPSCPSVLDIYGRQSDMIWCLVRYRLYRHTSKISLVPDHYNKKNLMVNKAHHRNFRFSSAFKKYVYTILNYRLVSVQ